MIGPRPGAVSAATIIGAGGVQPYDAALAAIAAAAPDDGLATTSAPGIVQLSADGGVTAGRAVQASDSRLSLGISRGQVQFLIANGFFTGF